MAASPQNGKQKDLSMTRICGSPPLHGLMTTPAPSLMARNNCFNAGAQFSANQVDYLVSKNVFGISSHGFGTKGEHAWQQLLKLQATCHFEVDTEDEQGMVAVTHLEANKGMPALKSLSLLTATKLMNTSADWNNPEPWDNSSLTHHCHAPRIRDGHTTFGGCASDTPSVSPPSQRKNATRHKQHFNPSFWCEWAARTILPRKLCHGPLECGGVSIKTIWNEQGSQENFTRPATHQTQGRSW